IAQGNGSVVELHIAEVGNEPERVAQLNVSGPTIGREHFHHVTFGGGDFPTPGNFFGRLRVIALYSRMLGEEEVRQFPFEAPERKQLPASFSNHDFEFGAENWEVETNGTFSVTDGIARLRTGDEESFETAVLRPVPQVPRKALSDAMTIEARGRVFLHATLDTEYIEARRD